jgi:hypothetical protein
MLSACKQKLLAALEEIEKAEAEGGEVVRLGVGYIVDHNNGTATSGWATEGFEFAWERVAFFKHIANRLEATHEAASVEDDDDDEGGED